MTHIELEKELNAHIRKRRIVEAVESLVDEMNRVEG